MFARDRPHAPSEQLSVSPACGVSERGLLRHLYMPNASRHDTLQGTILQRKVSGAWQAITKR